MNNGGEREDWIKELTETSEQLGRLSAQLVNIKDQDFLGIIGRIERTKSRLEGIRDWLSRLD